MRRWVPYLLDDLVLPVLVAMGLALIGSLPFREGAVFFPAAEIAATLFRRHAPIAAGAARILGPLAAPLPAMLLIWLIWPEAELLEAGVMALHWLVYLAYATAMAFFLPVLEALVGAPERYPDDESD